MRIAIFSRYPQQAGTPRGGGVGYGSAGSGAGAAERVGRARGNAVTGSG